MQKERLDDGTELVPLTGLLDSMESEMLQDLLRQEGIPIIAREEGGGGYMKLYMGYSVFGETLYVQQRDFIRANELLQALRQNGESALREAQTDAFDDVRSFEEYELEQQEAAQQDLEESGEKEQSVIPIFGLILVTILLAMWNLKH